MTVQQTETPTRPLTVASPKRTPDSLIRRYAWVLVALFMVALSTALVLWAGTRPGYDPYGWLVWGYQTLHLSLNLGGAPSWKPLSWLLTVPYSLFGHYALWMWMITSVTISLSASIFAGRIAYRLTGADDRRRYPAIVAAVFAGAAVLGIQGYMHYILSVQSDPMIVTFCLAAVDCVLSGRPRWAFALLVLASLGRPEAWSWLGLYAIWAWAKFPSMRWMLCAGLALVPVLWFGVPTITNHQPLIAGQLAELSPRALHQNKIVGTLQRFFGMHYLPVELAALVAVAIAAYRRDRIALVLAGAAVLWVLVEIAFAFHGWPAVERYMFEPAELIAVLAAVAVGWVLREAPRIGRGIPKWTGILVVAVLVGTLVPSAVSQVRIEHRDLRHERARTTEINKLNATINSLGGYKRVLACGRPVTNVEYASVIAWYVKYNTGYIGYRPTYELRQTYPIVMFTSLRNGWAVQPFHIAASGRAACANMTALYVPTAGHPQGVLVPK
jgi:hypothetical protein